MRRAALLLALLAAPASAQDAPVDNSPDARAARALAVLDPIDVSSNWRARCDGFLEATMIVGINLRHLAQHGIVAPWPDDVVDPLAWIEEAPARNWQFRGVDEGPDYTQLYLDAFRGIRWTVVNLPIFQRDKATCLALIEGADEHQP